MKSNDNSPLAAMAGMTVNIPGRICGRSIVQEMVKTMNDAHKKHYDRVISWHIGTAVEQALKENVPVVFQFSNEHKTSFLGIPFLVNDLLTPDGWALLDKSGRVLAVGNLKGMENA